MKKQISFLSSFIIGISISLILTIILFYILGIILSSTTIPEKIITPAILVITGTSILISTSIVMIKNNEKGLIKRRNNWNNIFFNIIHYFKYLSKKF